MRFCMSGALNSCLQVMSEEYSASDSLSMDEPCTWPPTTWWPHHWCPNSWLVMKNTPSGRSGSRKSEIKPAPSEVGMVFGKL